MNVTCQMLYIKIYNQNVWPQHIIHAQIPQIDSKESLLVLSGKQILKVHDVQKIGTFTMKLGYVSENWL